MLAVEHHEYGKNTLTQEIIDTCVELTKVLSELDLEDVAVRILEQHLEMYRVDLRFNLEKYSKHIFDFNPKLVDEIEDLLEHAARLRERCIKSFPNTAKGTEPTLLGISRLIMRLGSSYSNIGNYEKGLSMNIFGLLIGRAIFGRDTVNESLVESLRVVGYS